MLHLRRLAAAAATALLAACTQPHPPAEPADTIFIGDHIIAMDGSTPEAVAIRGETIVATGPREDLIRYQGPQTRLVELGEHALLPGFIDSHSHLTAQARLADFANIGAPPVGPVTGIPGLQDVLRAGMADRPPATGGWVIGFGYDESLLDEQRVPTRDDLDAVSTDVPVLIIHTSLHFGVLNSRGLEAMGITSATPNPVGGEIRRRPGTDEPDGVLNETAFQAVLFRIVIGSKDDPGAKFRAALGDYASKGVTTAQDGATTAADLAILTAEAARDPLPIDLAVYPFAVALDEATRETIDATPYSGGLRIAGVKFVLDGSIQGLTGFLSQPYLQVPPGADETYRGQATMLPEVFEQMVGRFLDRGVPVLVHANGDSAIDEVIDTIDRHFAGGAVPDHRTVIIHAQMMREDQLDRIREDGLIPSYFSAHPYYWGDWHRRILGDERAARISPIRSTADRNIRFTIHNDTPVVPMDMMRLLAITVNRTTRSGYVLGPDQRATVMEALQALTINGAYSLFEEDTKGSITPGKQADLVILGSDPLTADPATLADIPVLETISRGRTVYLAN